MDKIPLTNIVDLWYRTPKGHAYLLAENERLKNQYDKLIKEKGEKPLPPPKQIKHITITKRRNRLIASFLLLSRHYYRLFRPLSLSTDKYSFLHFVACRAN